MKKIYIPLIVIFILLLIYCNSTVNLLAAPKGVKIGEGIQVGNPEKQKDVRPESKLKLSISSNKKTFTARESIAIEVRIDCFSDSQYLVDFSNLSVSLSMDGRSTQILSPVKENEMEEELYIDKNTFIGKKFFLNNIYEMISSGTYRLKFHYSLKDEGLRVDSNELKLTVIF